MKIIVRCNDAGKNQEYSLGEFAYADFEHMVNDIKQKCPPEDIIQIELQQSAEQKALDGTVSTDVLTRHFETVDQFLGFMTHSGFELK